MDPVSVATSAFTPLDDPVYVAFGDQAHYACIFFTLLFALSVVGFADDNGGGNTSETTNDENEFDRAFFDEDWVANGFCNAHADVPYLSSHDVCFYVDVTASVLLAVIYLVFGRRQSRRRSKLGQERTAAANQLLLPVILYTVAHGLGHFAIAKSIRDGLASDTYLPKTTTMDVLSQMTWTQTLSQMAPMFLFWLGSVKAIAFHIHNWAVVVALAALAWLGQTQVPGVLAFTYVQTVLLVAFSMNQLLRSRREKDFIYATYPIIVTTPLTLVAWLESTQCSAFVKDKLYGHVVYDAFIPLSTLLWYTICFIKINQEEELFEEQDGTRIEQDDNHKTAKMKET